MIAPKSLVEERKTLIVTGNGRCYIHRHNLLDFSGTLSDSISSQRHKLRWFQNTIRWTWHKIHYNNIQSSLLVCLFASNLKEDFWWTTRLIFRAEHEPQKKLLHFGADLLSKWKTAFHSPGPGGGLTRVCSPALHWSCQVTFWEKTMSDWGIAQHESNGWPWMVYWSDWHVILGLWSSSQLGLILIGRIISGVTLLRTKGSF